MPGSRKSEKGNYLPGNIALAFTMVSNAGVIISIAPFILCGTSVTPVSETGRTAERRIFIGFAVAFPPGFSSLCR